MPNADTFIDFELPPELIAQSGIEPRDAARLLVVDRSRQALADYIFSDLPELLKPDDILVVNDSKVIPSRLITRRASGGKVELLLLERRDRTRWEALARPLSRLRSGEMLEIVAPDGTRTARKARFEGREGTIAYIDLLDASIPDDYGRLPLPPYIQSRLDDGSRYQTVYSDEAGSAAAPTAGLHFTPQLLERCRDRRIEVRKLTLHVGIDTFRPLETEDPEQHTMHSEWFRVPTETWDAVRCARRDGRRVVSVGTTVTRVLETLAEPGWPDGQLTGRTAKFIRPPYRFLAVDAQVTNFHLPRTTLLLLVGAFTSSGLLRRAYEHAIRRRYRFYSFGDAMLIV